MKKLLFTLVLLLSSVVGNAQTFKFGDVNKDGEVNISDVMTVVDIIMNGYKPLTLSSENVVVNYGSSAKVDISFGYGPYTVTCSNENLVGVSLNGTLLSIMGKRVGTAVVTVTDMETGYTKDITVTVEKSYRTCPDDNHPHLIDLGLPSGTLWACCNVDTDHPENQSPTNYGGYYAWGETETKFNYSKSAYQYYKSDSYQSIGSDIAGTEYDVAHVKWGGSWVMASLSQQQELLDNCTSTWTTQNGVSGTLFTGANGGSIFLPAAGFRYNYTLNVAGSGGYYWSSTQDPSFAGNAYFLYSYSSGADPDIGNRYIGLSVRPVVSVSPVGNLELSITELVLTEGGVDDEEIISGSGNYTVASSDESVATATLKDYSITITAVSVGIATITVTDAKSGQTATIEVTVSPLCPDEHHPHLIDLGLPSGTTWACCNVDTDHPENQSPENYGGYYSWGETETKSNYSESTYQYKNFVFGSDIAGTKYDVAHVKWGGSWVMPSKEQQDELKNNCYGTWTEHNGVSGVLLTGANGGSIFLPAAGYRDEFGSRYAGSYRCYWSSTPFAAVDAYYYSDSSNHNKRYYGCTVRPVVSN